MTRKQNDLEAVLRVLSRDPRRSPLFLWMREHHDDLAKAAKGQPIDWVPLCARFAEAGLTDGFGAPPSIEAARRTWRNVKKDVARRRAYLALTQSQAEPKRAPPAKSSAEMRPRVITAGKPAPDPPSRPTPTVGGTAEAGPEGALSDDAVQEKLAAVKRQRG